MRAPAIQTSCQTRDPTRRYVDVARLCAASAYADDAQQVEHAGYRRYILQRNPPRYDPDGDIVEPSDEYEDEDDLEAVEENPYADIRLERTWGPVLPAQATEALTR